jgi:hypothetical protein
MTAHPLRLADSQASRMGWHWLTPAVEMAAKASGNWPLEPDPAPQGWTCYPRLATRTPGVDGRSVRVGRDFTIATLRRWGADERSDDVATVVSELLTNALRHTQASPGGLPRRAPVRLGLLQPGPCVLCAVADPAGSVPVLKDHDYFAETGRGLHVISAFSDAWGYTTPSEKGKTVWAIFSADPISRPHLRFPRRDWRAYYPAPATL